MKIKEFLSSKHCVIHIFNLFTSVLTALANSPLIKKYHYQGFLFYLKITIIFFIIYSINSFFHLKNLKKSYSGNPINISGNLPFFITIFLLGLNCYFLIFPFEKFGFERIKRKSIIEKIHKDISVPTAFLDEISNQIVHCDSASKYNNHTDIMIGVARLANNDSFNKNLCSQINKDSYLIPKAIEVDYVINESKIAELIFLAYPKINLLAYCLNEKIYDQFIIEASDSLLIVNSQDKMENHSKDSLMLEFPMKFIIINQLDKKTKEIATYSLHAVQAFCDGISGRFNNAYNEIDEAFMSIERNEHKVYNKKDIINLLLLKAQSLNAIKTDSLKYAAREYYRILNEFDENNISALLFLLLMNSNSLDKANEKLNTIANHDIDKKEEVCSNYFERYSEADEFLNRLNNLKERGYGLTWYDSLLFKKNDWILTVAKNKIEKYRGWCQSISVIKVH